MTINILQGNSLQVLKGLDSESVDMCITSPPYWESRDCDEPERLGFEATHEEYIYKLILILGEVRRVLKNTGTCWVNLGELEVPTGIPEHFCIEMMNGGWIKRNTIIWDKKVEFEYLYLFTKGPECRLERFKDYVWRIPAPESYPGFYYDTYPEELISLAIKAGCPEGGTVLDPFVGSGTTLKVARALGRKSIGIDLTIELVKKRMAKWKETE